MSEEVKLTIQADNIVCNTRMALGAIHDVVLERLRQQTQEAFSVERDDGYTDRSLARAAATYAYGASGSDEDYRAIKSLAPSTFRGRVWDLWPKSWASKWYKPKSRREDLVKAGALILAEIERIDRAAAK